MKVAVIGATGNVGTRLTKELLSRGHQVIAVSRDVEKVEKQDGVTVAAAATDDAAQLADAIRGADAVVSALPFRVSSPDVLIDAVRRSGVQRYLVVGGAASLYATGTKERIIDSGKIPEEWMPEVGGGARFLDRIRQEGEIDWVFLSPSMFFGPGERTGKFRLGKDELLTAEDGKSSISYEDFSVALVDELEQPKHHRERFTVGY